MKTDDFQFSTITRQNDCFDCGDAGKYPTQETRLNDLSTGMDGIHTPFFFLYYYLRCDKSSIHTGVGTWETMYKKRIYCLKIV